MATDSLQNPWNSLYFKKGYLQEILQSKLESDELYEEPWLEPEFQAFQDQFMEREWLEDVEAIFLFDCIKRGTKKAISTLSFLVDSYEASIPMIFKFRMKFIFMRAINFGYAFAENRKYFDVFRYIPTDLWELMDENLLKHQTPRKYNFPEAKVASIDSDFIPHFENEEEIIRELMETVERESQQEYVPVSKDEEEEFYRFFEPEVQTQIIPEQVEVVQVGDSEVSIPATDEEAANSSFDEVPFAQSEVPPRERTPGETEYFKFSGCNPNIKGTPESYTVGNPRLRARDESVYDNSHCRL
jgi:hypothetical protein